MWSRKPTPVDALGLAGAVQRQPQAHAGLARGALDLGRAWWCGGRQKVSSRGAYAWSPEPAGEPALASADSACTGNPSARATLLTCGASARAADSGNDTNACLRRNVAAPSGPEKRAAPPVGSTWLEPAA